MTKLLKNLKPHGDNPGNRTAGSSNVMLGIGVLGVIALCFIACSTAASAWSAVFRVVWLVLTSVGLILLAYLSRLQQQLTVRRMLLLSSMIVAQLLIMNGVCSLKGLVPGFYLEGQLLLWLPYALAPTILAVIRYGRTYAMTLAIIIR